MKRTLAVSGISGTPPALFGLIRAPYMKVGEQFSRRNLEDPGLSQKGSRGSTPPRDVQGGIKVWGYRENIVVLSGDYMSYGLNS